MKRQLIKLKEQLGWQGMSGLVLLALVGLLHLLALQPLERETEFMRNRLDVAHSRANTQFDSGDRQRELGMFFDSLPTEQDVTDILASISAVAEASRIEIKQAEYRLDERNKPRIEYALYFPVQGGYANIRHFVFRVLADHPAMALDQINFQRDKVDDALLKAEIRFTLFIGDHPNLKNSH